MVDGSNIEIARITSGWRVEWGGLRLDAESPHFDRGAIRATLTVRNGAAIYFRDTANLTSARVRARVIRQLAEKGVTLEDRAIIALDEACRIWPRPPEENVVCDGGPDTSEKVLEFRALLGTVTSWLLLRDPDVLPVTLGAKKAHDLGGQPPWLLLVAPPSGVKTELLRTLWRVPGVYPLSELTARTFASGLETHGDDPSLLHRLRNEVLVLKDFTTVLEMHREERQAILAQLREIFDGRFDKVWGTGKELHWEGRLGFIAGVTPVIDSYQSVLSVLGKRFLMLRVEQPERKAVAAKALNNAEREPQMRKELMAIVQSFMRGLPTTPPTVAPELRDQLAELADFVTRCRSGVIRDVYRRELDYAPEPEMPTRLAKQLFELLRGVALVLGHPEATTADLDRIKRVALDCIPAVRRTVLRAVAGMATVDETLTTSKVAEGVQYSTATVRRALEDLQALGVLAVTKGGKGVADQWAVRDEWHAALDTVRAVERALHTRREETFAQMSEGAPRPYVSGEQRFYDEVERLAAEEREEAEQGTLKDYGVTMKRG
jgi:DeoR-like helix-turn-helix domain